MFRWTVLIACVLAALLGLAIGVLNPEPAAVALPGWSFELPLGSLLMLTFAVGLVCGLLIYMILFHLPARFGKRRAGSVAKSGLPERNA
ncbi:MAG: lipopolysaccharide assembly protein LapA domain-containing protein [Pseudomonadota bacterium]